MTHHQLTCGEDPPRAVIREWRYGPRQLRVDDEQCQYIISALTTAMKQPTDRDPEERHYVRTL